MIDVTFHTAESVPDELLKFAVIAAEYEGKWVFCRHRLRSTWEIPGGHREPGEDIAETARRELQEETGAVEAELRPLSVYGVTADGTTSYGMLFMPSFGSWTPSAKPLRSASFCFRKPFLRN